MASNPPRPNTQQDVMRFLEDLDSFTVPTKPTKPSGPAGATASTASSASSAAIASVAKSAASSSDILNFLDEMAGPAAAAAAAPGPAASARAASKPPSTSTSTSTSASASAAAAGATHAAKLPRPPSVPAAATGLRAAGPAGPAGPPPTSAAASASAAPAPPSASSVRQPPIHQQPQPPSSMVPPSTSHNDHNHNHDHDHKQDHPSSAGAAGSDWTWGSIWATAATTASAATARVSAVTVKGLETAKAMAEQTAHTVTSNDHVKGLYAGVAPEISKLGTDLSKLATSIADTIAPPISASSGSHGGSHGSSAFAPLVTVWMCAELRDADGLDVLHDFVQSTANEMWVRPFHAGADPKTGMPLMHDVQQHVDASAGSPAESRPADLSTQPIAPGTTLRCGHVCNKAVVNSVKDPDPLIAKSLGEAIEHTEAIIGRLEKLAQANPPPQLPASAHAASPTGAATVVASPLSAYLVIQPFTTQLPPSLLSETPQTHTQYLCTLLCDAGEAGLFSPRAISQSVLTRDTVPSAPLNHVRWETTMHRRVIETSVADLCEELVVALQWS